jgi:hypothetical protein
MSQDFNINTELDSDDFDFDEYYPEEAFEALVEAERLFEDVDKVKTDEVATVVVPVSNDEFLKAIFGSSFSSAHPLVCKKSGDPVKYGWKALRWPCQAYIDQTPAVAIEPKRNWPFRYTLSWSTTLEQRSIKKGSLTVYPHGQ